MAVTTKTLTPTNQVVTIPDMAEKPNASVLIDCISKEADAINALDSNFTRLTTTTSSTDAKTIFVRWLNDNKNSLPINHGSIIAFRTSNYPNYDVAYGIICCITANYGKMKIVSYYGGIDGEYVLNAGEWSAV